MVQQMTETDQQQVPAGERTGPSGAPTAPWAKASRSPGRFSLFPPAFLAVRPGPDSGFFRGAPSLPPGEMPEIIIRAPGEMRILVAALMVSIFIFTAFYWSDLGFINQKLIAVLNLLVLAGVVDYFQKVYVFRGDSVARRVLFRWFRYPLPAAFTVHREPSGAIAITDDRNNTVILAIGRDMVDNRMAQALKDLYQCQQESNFEIG